MRISINKNIINNKPVESFRNSSLAHATVYAATGGFIFFMRTQKKQLDYRFDLSGTLTPKGATTETTIISDPFALPKKSKNDKLSYLVEDFLFTNDSASTTDMLMTIYQAFVTSPKYSEYVDDFKSDVNFTVSQIIQFSINANQAVKEVKNG